MLAPHTSRLMLLLLSNLRYRFVDTLKITPDLGRVRTEADTRLLQTVISVKRTLISVLPNSTDYIGSFVFLVTFSL